MVEPTKPEEKPQLEQAEEENKD
jgi:zinc finger protein